MVMGSLLSQSALAHVSVLSRRASDILTVSTVIAHLRDSVRAVIPMSSSFIAFPNFKMGTPFF